MGSCQSHKKVDEDDNLPPFIVKRNIEHIHNNVPFNPYQNRYLTQDSIVNSVIAQFATRSNVGLEKYGTTLDREDLTILEWIQHTQEEMMDGTLYLEKLKKTILDAEKMQR